MAGNNVQRNFAGDVRPCSACKNPISVTEAMVRSAHYRCRACDSRIAAESARKHPDRKRRNNKAYFATEKGREAILRKTRTFRAKYPEKYAAHIAVQTAIRNGTLKPKHCSQCSALPANAHHDDYSKPLDVRWLCDDCHIAEHTMLVAREQKTAPDAGLRPEFRG